MFKKKKSKKEKISEADPVVLTSPLQKMASIDLGHYDVMISCSSEDTQIAAMLKDKLAAHGVSGWVNQMAMRVGEDPMRKIGQSIIDSKAFLPILSSSYLARRSHQDEVCLAYLSNKPIFPVALQPDHDLISQMDPGLRLQLSRRNWAPFHSQSQIENNFPEILEQLKSELQQQLPDGAAAPMPDDSGSDSGSQSKKTKKIRKRINTRKGAVRSVTEIGWDFLKTFWVRNFNLENVISWEDFLEKFSMEAVQLPGFTADNIGDLLSVLKRELRVDEDGLMNRDNFQEFNSIEGVWDRVQDLMAEEYTLKRVFDVESTVRIEAIENLGRFRSEAVTEALQDLLCDQDANVRAVAAISLARTGTKSREAVRLLIMSLEDKDRLVRQSACLALGKMKAKWAISKLVDVWRNDFISTVRESAQVSLKLIGGPEVDKAMRVTKVLDEELKKLSEPTQ